MTETKRKIRNGLLSVVYFFPFQLFFAHLKRNHLFLLYWVVLFGLIAQQFANKYGIPQLLLFPEYLGKVSMLSHVILGLACGSFIMAFNMSSYIMNGFRFPFIATLAKPFLKYTVNNFIFPLSFLALYSFQLAAYQVQKELLPFTEVALHLLGFLIGNAIFIGLALSYFVKTNKSIFKILNLPIEISKKAYKPIQNLFEPDLKWHQLLRRKSEWRIETYLTEKLQLRRARTSRHYKRATLQKVFQQNHLNASLFEIGAIASVFILGWFMELRAFEIPAGASIFLLFSMSLMFLGAFHNWLKRWSILAFVLLFLVGNEISKMPSFKVKSHAYGLDYSKLINYSNKALNNNGPSNMAVEASLKQEQLRLRQILANGKLKKLVVINTSGGGLRSALWSYSVLNKINEESQNRIFNSTALITGASGGMIGAAFYRELYLNGLLEKGKSNEFENQISADILNPLAFSWVVNDFFLRFRKLEYKGRFYPKDRGYAFEERLIANTKGIFDFSISKNDPFVQNGDIPEMFFAPTVVNDSRRMLFANSNLAYLTKSNSVFKTRNSLIDFRQSFKSCQADSLRFASVLRMNATFPYVLPNVSLPTQPEVEVMDAGLRDNFGASLTLQYLNALQEFLDSNVEEVIWIKIIDNADEITVGTSAKNSLSKSLTSPIGSVYQNLFNTQRLLQEENWALLSPRLKSKIKVVEFRLPFDNPNEVPLSWHLSAKSKKKIIEALKEEDNKMAVKYLNSLF